MTPVHLTIIGAPRTKKCHSQIVRVGGRVRLIPSKQYLAYRDDALWQLKAAWRREPIDLKVNCAAVFHRDRATGDLVNYLQALADILEDAGVIVNDRQIVTFDGSRLAKDAARPRVEVLLTLAA